MTDLIDRQSAIKIVGNINTWCSGWLDYAIKQLEELPSAHPDRKEAMWMLHPLPHGGESIDHDICSQCGEQYSDA